MSWTTAAADLRLLLSDAATDRLRFRKKIIGQQDGSNKQFKTYEYRRISNFTSATSPVGVYVNNTAATVTADDIVSGIFSLTNAPANTATVEATYYIQWFLDSEIVSFLNNASLFLSSTIDYTKLDPGLWISAQKYALHDAYLKLAARFAETTSAGYRLEDMPDQKLDDVIKTYESLAAGMLDEALKLRNEFYSRKGQSLAPRFQTLGGTVRKVEPNR